MRYIQNLTLELTTLQQSNMITFTAFGLSDLYEDLYLTWLNVICDFAVPFTLLIILNTCINYLVVSIQNLPDPGTRRNRAEKCKSLAGIREQELIVVGKIV